MPEDRGYPASGRPSKSSADKTAFEEEQKEEGFIKRTKKAMLDRLNKPNSGIINQGQKKQLDELEN